MTQRKIILKRGTRVIRVSAANTVPPMLAPDPSTDRSELGYGSQESNSKSVPEYKITNLDENVAKPKSTPERLNDLFTKLDCSGIEDWPEDLQKNVHDLMIEYQHLFALNDLELGNTSKVKHEIKLSNPVPFKDRYH